MLKRLALALYFACAATPLAAQKIDYAQRAGDLESLASAFGRLHHIRRLCEPRREAEVWRNRMRQLVELEQPQPALRDRMVQAFNAGFRQAESRFEFCDEDARDYAAAVAVDADAAVTRLMEPLYGALAESGELPEVLRGDPR